MLNFLVGLQIRTIGLQSRMTDALRGEEGQGLTEYALILAFIAVVAIAALIILGSDISSLLNKVGTELSKA
jgi:pilus assembly protein Flp/PilA